MPTLTVTVVALDGSTRSGVQVSVSLDSDDLVASPSGMVTTGPVSKVSNESGVVTFDLAASSDLEPETKYVVRIIEDGGERLTGDGFIERVFTMPDTDADLHDLPA